MKVDFLTRSKRKAEKKEKNEKINAQNKHYYYRIKISKNRTKKKKKFYVNLFRNFNSRLKMQFTAPPLCIGDSFSSPDYLRLIISDAKLAACCRYTLHPLRGFFTDIQIVQFV